MTLAITNQSARYDGQHEDILILDDDIALDDGGFPTHVDGRPSIGQDIKHMIRESQILVGVVAERSAQRRQLARQRVELLCESDTRLVPGTVRVSEQDAGKWWVQADTVDYNAVGFWL